MKNNIIISLFFTIVLCLVPVSTFVPYEIVDNYFQLFPIACAVGVVAFVSCIVLFVSKVRFYFAISDMLFIAGMHTNHMGHIANIRFYRLLS